MCGADGIRHVRFAKPYAASYTRLPLVSMRTTPEKRSDAVRSMRCVSSRSKSTGTDYETTRSSLSSVEDPFDHGARPAGDPPVLVAQSRLRTMDESEHAPERLGLRARHRERIARRVRQQ